MTNSRCEHDFLPGQCSSCKKAPFGLNENVFITKNSQAFHNDSSCSFLESGQNFAEKRGGTKQPHLVRRWDQVITELGACEWCCALFLTENLSPKIRCLAKISGKWVLVRFLRDRFVDFGSKEFQVYDEVHNRIHFLDSDEIQFL
jgi:hypothetical protein